VKDELIRGFFFSELLLELPKSLLIPLLADLLTESEGEPLNWCFSNKYSGG
jgi:hypothetical protein